MVSEPTSTLVSLPFVLERGDNGSILYSKLSLAISWESDQRNFINLLIPAGDKNSTVGINRAAGFSNKVESLKVSAAI